MARIVMKFGGTSLGSLDRIGKVAQHIKREYEAGHDVAVVVSAMAGETNRLLGLATAISSFQDTRELDVVISSGEQVSSGLLALALQNIEVPARSFLGWQVPLMTSPNHGMARIKHIETDALNALLARRYVGVVAGFQGISEQGRITTLGRGGSDTSAVGLAVVLQADRCDIYSDVDGVYTADPNIVPKARKLDMVCYEEMLEMASLGAKILQTRSVELAQAHHMPLCVRSSFDDPYDKGLDKKPVGTMICSEDDMLEHEIVKGITYTRNEAKITIRGIAHMPNMAGKLFAPLAEASINVDMIVQNMPAKGETTNITFTIPYGELGRAKEAILSVKKDVSYESLESAKGFSKISIIGIGMRSHAGIAQRMFRALGEHHINLHAISTSEIKVSVLIDAKKTDEAVAILHKEYGLENEST